MFLGSISRLRGFRVTVSKKRKKIDNVQGSFCTKFQVCIVFLLVRGRRPSQRHRTGRHTSIRGKQKYTLLFTRHPWILNQERVKIQVYILYYYIILRVFKKNWASLFPGRLLFFVVMWEGGGRWLDDIFRGYLSLTSSSTLKKSAEWLGYYWGGGRDRRKQQTLKFLTP